MVIMDTVACYTELFSDVQRPIYMSKEKVCRAVNKIRGPKGFPPATLHMASSYFHRKVGEKQNQQKSLTV